MGVHAEGAHKVFKFLRAVDDLALVKLIGEMSEGVCGQLNPDAYIDPVGAGGNIEGSAHALYPLAPASPDGDDARFAVKALLARRDAVAAADALNIGDGGVEMEIDLALKLLIDIAEHDIVYISAEVADLRVQQMQTVLETFALYLGIGGGVELRVLSAVAEIDLVNVLHKLNGSLLTDVFKECAAELVGNVILAVGESARTAEAAHDAANRAFDAAFHLVPVDGAAALVQCASKLKNAYFQLFSGICKLIGRKNAAGTGADYYNVVLHEYILLL